MRTLANAMADYFLHCRYERNLSLLTYKAYTLDLQQFLKIVGENRPLSEINKNDIRSYLQGLFNLQYNASSIRRKLASIRGFFKYWEFEEALAANPMWRIQLHIRTAQKLPKTISRDALQSLLSHVWQELKQNNDEEELSKAWERRNKLRELGHVVILELLFSTGVRVGELCKLNVGDIDMMAKTVKVFGKGSKERMLFVTHQDVVTSLNQYLHLRKHFQSDSNALFLNRIRKRMQPHSIRALLRYFAQKAHLSVKITPHMIRHTTATLMLENGIDIRVVQKMLGHSSISTTQLYTHVSSTAERKIIEARHPRNLLSSFRLNLG